MPTNDQDDDATGSGDSADAAPVDKKGGRRPSRNNNPRFPHPAVFIVLIVLVTAIAVAIHQVEPAQPGAFYTPPTPLPDGPPGTIIRTQLMTGGPEEGAQTWLVLYKSTGMANEPIAVSGVIFIPNGPVPEGGRNVVAWAHPTTGVASTCAPSLQPGGDAARVPGLSDFLAAGDVVAATDYPGLGTPGPHPYLVGNSEGMAVLDSVRAAHNFPPAAAGTTFAVWGHSQGGQASLFTGQLAPTYAPDLTLVGVAAAAPATDLSQLLQKDIGGIAGNVLGSMAVVSWSQVYANQGLTLGQVVDTDAIPMAKLIADYCIESEAQLVVDLPETEVLRVGFLSNPPWSTPPWDAILTQNSAGAVAIKVPVLVNQGTADTVVWPSVTTGWVSGQCAAGVSIAETLYPNVTHTNIGFDSADDSAAWIAARFAGTPAPTGCSTTTAPLATTSGSTPGTTTALPPGTTPGSIAPASAGTTPGTTPN